MKLTWPEREAIYHAALEYGARHFKDCGAVMSYESKTTDAFRVQLLPIHCMATVVLLEVTFHGVSEAIMYFTEPAVPVQLSLFEVSNE